jgi:hypothetical protein
MTAEETRVEFLKALTDLGWTKPDWRLGQTLSNLAMAAGRLDAGAVWDLEDEEGLAAARRLLTQGPMPVSPEVVTSIDLSHAKSSK